MLDLIAEMRMAGAKLLTPDKSATKTATQAEEEAAQDLFPTVAHGEPLRRLPGSAAPFMADYRSLGEGGTVEMRGSLT